MLTYALEKTTGKPLYLDLYEHIKRDILDGVLHPGERLPSKRQLAEHLNLGLITVANAYQQLQTEGFIRSQERHGYFVENVTDYRSAIPDQPGIVEQLDEPVEHQYLMDFKANRTSISNFPSSVWARLMRESLNMPNESMLATVPYNGLLELRQAIASYLARTRGIRVQPAQIIIGAGTEYLYGRLMQMFGHECTLALEDPGYRKFAAISASYGNPVTYVPIDENGLVVGELERSGAQVVHVSPANHFPTGIVMPITRRLELFEWANRKRDRYIIEDDYDSEFRFSGKVILPMFAESRADKVIYINTFSKTMVPSLRISYMVLPPALLKRYLDTMSFYSCTVSSFEQHALARFIDEGHLERHISRMRNYYRKQRELVIRSIQDSPLGAISTITEHNAGTHFLLGVRTTLTEDQIRQAGIERNLNISMFSDYRHRRKPGAAPTLVINYACVDPETFGKVVAMLCSIFPECR